MEWIQDLSRFGAKKGVIFITIGGALEVNVNGRRQFSKKLKQMDIKIPSLYFIFSEHKKMVCKFQDFIKDVLSKELNGIRKQFLVINNTT